MKLKKPPVVEAWIEFKVGLADESKGWDENTAREFIHKHFAEFKHLNLFGLIGVEIDPKTKEVSKTEPLFERVRAFTQDRDHCVQAGRNLLVYHQIRKEEREWPSYEQLRNGAFDALQKYLDFRNLRTLVGVYLHYRDIVAIPKGKNDTIKLEDYFTVYPHLPDGPFGAMSAFRIVMQLPDVCKNGNMTLGIQSLPISEPSEDKGRFAMDWHVSSNQEMPSINSAQEWLAQAHSDLMKVFVAAFTPQGFNLFEPEER